MQAPDTTSLKQHLKELGGCGDAEGEVLLATVGLSALGACVMAAVDVGERNINVLMCSTAYGGSSQQTDILSKTVGLEKHTFDIQGVAGDVFTALKSKLEEMASFPFKPLLFVQLEYPTNPDMKDCDISKLEEVLKTFSAATGSKVVLMMDTTFSPQSQSAKGFKDVPVIVFNSLSKSVSGGFTTGGSLVANHHPIAQQILGRAHKHLALFDTGSKGCQLKILSEMHSKCEERVAQAHENCIVAAAQLEACVHKYSRETMKVNFVTDTQRANHVTPATFSFNLPPPASLRNDHSALESLAQSFVDKLVEQHPQGIKPCVSFGQKNHYVYATVPATSTQGVISEEDKAKQAVGGVQLVRFSFPPTMDMSSWNTAIDAAIGALYNSASKL